MHIPLLHTFWHRLWRVLNSLSRKNITVDLDWPKVKILPLTFVKIFALFLHFSTDIFHPALSQPSHPSQCVIGQAQKENKLSPVLIKKHPFTLMLPWLFVSSWAAGNSAPSDVVSNKSKTKPNPRPHAGRETSAAFGFPSPRALLGEHCWNCLLRPEARGILQAGAAPVQCPRHSSSCQAPGGSSASSHTQQRAGQLPEPQNSTGRAGKPRLRVTGEIFLCEEARGYAEGRICS